LRLREGCEATDKPWLVFLRFFPFHTGEAADLVKFDPGLILKHGCEELALNHLLSGEEEDTVSPLLTDVAFISFEVNVPSEWTSLRVLYLFPVGVLVEEQLWVVNLSCEDKVVLGGTLTTLSILLTFHLSDALRDFF